jgi:beta-lactamase class A
VAGRSGTVLAAVYDLNTGQGWTMGQGGEPQNEASIVKVDILETLFAQQRGGLSATDQALAQQMIEDSDNDAATALWEAVGGASGIRAYNQAVGLTSTTPSSCVQCPGFPWPGWGLTTTTPADQISLLMQLVRPGTSVGTADRDYALRLMENVAPSQRWGVSGGVPAQVTVALKNGWLPLNDAETDWQVNSVGWVSGQGRDYLIAVLSTGNPTEAYGIDTIDQLSAIVWNGLG